MTGDWMMIYPEIVDTFHEDYYHAVDIMDYEPKKADKIFRKIIKACGNGHIDAILHLGLLQNDLGKKTEGNALVNKAHTIALEAIPTDFNADTAKIPWPYLENRPFLRTFHAIGLEYINEKQFEKALEKFKFILKVNPGDNQGVRFLLPECLIRLYRYDDFLKLDEKSEDSESIEYSYSRVLSYYKLGHFDNAKLEFKSARKLHPHVADELIKDNHAFPTDETRSPYGVPTGSKQEAFDYWLRTRDVWDKEKGFKEFIKSV